MKVERITVLGAGTMGHGIAQVAALSFYETTLFDANATALDAGMGKTLKSFERLAEKLVLSGADAQLATARLHKAASLEDAVKNADLIIEAVPENIALKKSLLQQALAAAPKHTIFASNTSSLPVTDIAAAASDPSRVCGMHFFNPPFVLKLLELVRAEQTSDATMQTARSVGERMGREIIEVKDSPGFATSRLGVVLALEAMRMVETGVASAADIDRAMEHGYRHQTGPLRTTDLVGLDVRLAIAEHLFATLGGEQYRAPEILRAKVKAGELGKKTGRGFYEWS